MRIVYNLRDQDWQTTKSLGILHVATRVLDGLAAHPRVERLDVLANRSLAPHLATLPSSDRVRVHCVNTPAPRGWQRLWWDQWSVVRRCNDLAPQWLLLPKGFSPLVRWPRARVSAYVHDNLFGYYARKGLRPFPAGQAALFVRMLRQTARRADAIVTNSAFTALELQRDFTPRVPPLRIGAPLGPAPAGAPADAASSLLLPTSAWPHKLTAQAIAWLQRWAEERGFQGEVHGFGTLPPGCAWPALARWTHHGRVDDRRLAELEARAAALIYFSDYEGYGLPPVEAAAAGRRAIASDLPPLRETMPAAALFDNGDFGSFARTLDRALASAPLVALRTDSAREVADRWLDALLQA